MSFKLILERIQAKENNRKKVTTKLQPNTAQALRQSLVLCNKRGRV